VTDIPNITALRDGTEVRTQPIAYLVSAWPEDLAEHSDASTWCLTVRYRGGGLWGVHRGDGPSGPSLSASGEWSYGRADDENPDEWRAQHRFPLDRALALAREIAPKIRMVGMTTLECIAWHREHEGRDD
jgi:hypothetical protein